MYTDEDVTQIAERVALAIKNGSVDRKDVERLLEQSHSEQSHSSLAVIRAVGITVGYAGLALMYAANFAHFSNAIQITTPYIFPALSIAICAMLVRFHRPRWELDVAAAIGYASLGGAIAAGIAGFQSTTLAIDTYLLPASAAAGALAIAVLRLAPMIRTSTWALAASSIAVLNLGAHALDVAGDNFRWIELLGTAIAIIVGVSFRRSRPSMDAALSTGMLLSFVASVIGISMAGGNSLSWWHALISIAVAGAVVLGSGLRLPAMLVVGIGGSILWISLMIGIVVEQPAWAVLVLAMGAALVAGTQIANHMRKQRQQ